MAPVWRRIYKRVKRGARFLRPLLPRVLQAHPWAARDDTSAFRRREYRSYQAYVAHQRRKLGRLPRQMLAEYDVRYREALRDRLARGGIVRAGSSVLCLAARIGTEVKAFLDLGCFAVGIDLNPGERNPYVLVGDFHQLQFAAESVDVVFTNSLDHAYDLERVLKEVHRVLKPGGVLVAELGLGEREGGKPNYYEALAWPDVNTMVERVVAHGFAARGRRPIDYPWRGEQIAFARC
ncbi:MAG TPA: class I SAM-dependent methyltransferase [Gemmatimonadaceae bacterium]